MSVNLRNTCNLNNWSPVVSWQVRQKQHDLAMAVVMDSNMDAVIVDKEETVRRS